MTHDTDIGFSPANYYLQNFNRVFGPLMKPDIAPMDDLSPEQQKNAWHDGEQVERNND